jgi:hypothetical protein
VNNYQYKPAHNSTYKKLAVHWLIDALCFVASSVVADSFRLRNRQLLVAANRWWQVYEIINHHYLTVVANSRFLTREFKTERNNCVLKCRMFASHQLFTWTKFWNQLLQ